MIRLLRILLLVLALPSAALAQITIPNSFAPDEVIFSTLVNGNFLALGSDALNRTGGTITGNVTVSAGITIDGVDISTFLGQNVSPLATPTFASLTISSPDASSLDIAGGLNAGTGNVAIIDSTGRIPAISSTYFGSLSGTSLTGIAMLASANTYTAINNFKTYSETKVAPTIGGGALAIDLSAGTQFDIALNGNATITLSNPVASGSGGSFLILFTNDGTLRSLTWPASVKWASGVVYAPTQTVNKIDAVQCVYNNGGTSYLCTAVLNFF